MAATTNGTQVNSSSASHEKLNEDLDRLLTKSQTNLELHALGSYSAAYETMYLERMRDGIESLKGTISIANNPAWDDAMAYAREVILAPKDTPDRASSPWTRSCSDLHKELLKRFGPGTIEAAELGTASIIAKHYEGDSLLISHVNKKASHLRHQNDAKVGAGFYPQSSPLAAICYQTAALPTSLAMSWFFSAEEAVQAAYISHLSVCDDLGSFTAEDYDVRMRMVAIATGVAYKHGGRVLNMFVDGIGKQAVGSVSGELRPIEAAMAWRTIGGCSTVYSKYHFDETCDLDVGLVAPICMMAMHDLLDWRCDVAAGNHENAVSAVYGFGVASPFHAFLETMLKEALKHPKSGMYGMAGVVWMHFVVGRYGGWEYRGEHGPACKECVRLLQRCTKEAGLEWAPKPPPKSYEDGDEAREGGRLWADHFIDRSLIQETTSWFQHLISTGEIWLFDLLAEGTQAVDAGADWA
ncbi:hypothetical protein O1611_g472 [Lasiodiplodia mahajangana]|uniref:Uncharacterized protein n=1 Tax=Lasiodiplodia mahajangana TaxID=1108764 RepID=A0ACC2K0B5_9PEZI|nr:hypothetical protein O1611_g472 [Lasiodiplodia mahajangana]